MQEIKTIQTCIIFLSNSVVIEICTCDINSRIILNCIIASASALFCYYLFTLTYFGGLKVVRLYTLS